MQGNKWSCLIYIVLASLTLAQSARGDNNVLRNGGFEMNAVAGTIPWGWKALDENGGYERWTACRNMRSNRGVLPPEGEWMAAIDTELMGIDTNGEDFSTCRSALYQTVQLAGGSKGDFSVLFNDHYATSGGWVSPIRLAVSWGETDLDDLKVDDTDSQLSWSKSFYKIDIQYSGSGDWTRASIRFEVPESAEAVPVTFWIGMFDNSSGTEEGYWRVDDARAVLQKD